MNDNRVVDADRFDEGRRLWRPVLAALVIGILVGGLLGSLYGVSQPVTYTASTSLSVLPDSAINTADQNNGLNQDAPAFIQGELVTLNGDQLADTVQQALGLPGRPDIVATEVGQTYAVQIVATAATASRASQIATNAANQYASIRRNALTRQIDDAISANNKQLQTTTSQLQTAQASTPATAAPTPTEQALQTEYQNLLQTGNTLNATLPQVYRVVQVIAPSNPSDSSTSTLTTSSLAGALIGAIIALIVLFLLRRNRPRIRSVGDLATLNVPVLLPVLPSRRVPDRPSAWRSSEARLLAARLVDAGDTRRPLVVVGPSAGVGTSFVAVALAASLSERGPVLLVQAGAPSRVTGDDTSTVSTVSPPEADVDAATMGNAAIQRVAQSTIPGVWVLPQAATRSRGDGLRAARDSVLVSVLRRATAAGWQVVVDAPALADSDVAVDCVGADADAILIVARNLTRPAEVLGAAELFAARGSALTGTVLNSRPGPLRRRLWRAANDTDGLVSAGEPDRVPTRPSEPVAAAPVRAEQIEAVSVPPGVDTDQ